MPSPHAAVRRLHVGGELALEQAEATPRRAHGHPERSPRQHLTIGAIAQVDVVRIDLGFVAHVPAMARTLNLHESLRSDCSLTLAVEASPRRISDVLRWVVVVHGRKRGRHRHFAATAAPRAWVTSNRLASILLASWARPTLAISRAARWAASAASLDRPAIVPLLDYFVPRHETLVVFS